MSGRPQQQGRKVLIHIYERIWPPNCGVHLRVWQVIDAFQQQGIEVHVVSSHSPWSERGTWTIESRQYLEKRGVKLHLAPFHLGSLDFWLTAARNIWSKKLLQQRFFAPSSHYYLRPELQKLWRQVIKKEKPVLTYVNYAYWHRLATISRAQGVKSVIEMIDLLADQYVATVGESSRNDITKEKIVRMFADELECLSCGSYVVAINSEEGSRVRQQLNIPVIDVPFCLADMTPTCEVMPTADILVVGSAIEHNKLGLRQFIAGAWPTIKTNRPNVRLVVCGGVGECLAPDPNIVYQKRVPDLTPYYHNTRLVLLTSVAGAGIKIKAIEALAHGACIVAHKHSVQAIPFQDGRDGAVISDLSRAAPTILRLLARADECEMYRRRAKQLFLKHYQLEHGRKALACLLENPNA